MRWVVVYVRVTGDWKADGVRKWKESCDCSDTKVSAVQITLTLIVKKNCSSISALLSCGWWFQYVVGCGLWTSHWGLKGWWSQGWYRDGKWKSCELSDMKVLAVPIALTLIVKMNHCIVNLALLSCGWWFQYVVGWGVCTSHGGLKGWWSQGWYRDRKWKSCELSDMKVLAIPIALTLIVKMNCIVNLEFSPI
jgi:hypothetical protein